MNNFARNFLTEWRKLGLPFKDETFIAAVSGGADSVGLLLVLEELRRLKKLNLRFVVAHFNHALRGEESEKDAEFVRHLTTEFKFEFVCKIANLHSPIANQKGNLEQNARNARYEFLRETAENLRAYGVLTAHTRNDQAETFLLNLIRGSGLEGLGGIKAKRFLETEKRRKGDGEKGRRGDGEKGRKLNLLQKSPHLPISPSPFLPFSPSPLLLIRPLLNWAKREDTENFCRFRNIEFRYDTMNEDLSFQRVRIRKILLPMLKDFNPQIIENLAKTASLLRADFDELNSFFGENAKQFDETNLSLKELKTLSSATLRRGLQHWLRARRGDLRSLETKHFTAIESLISSPKSGKIVELPNGEKVLKENGKLIFQKLKVEK